MATAYPIETENREDNYELELSRVREKINQGFIRPILTVFQTFEWKTAGIVLIIVYK